MDDQIPSIHDARGFLNDQWTLCPARLSSYAHFLRVGLEYTYAGVDGIIEYFYPDEWRGGPITTVIYSLAYYCLGVRAIQDLWMESFANCGLLDHLLRVVELIPWGYSREGQEISSESWDEIHSVLRYLLLDRSFRAYDERIQGYSFERLVWWARFIIDYEEEYTIYAVEDGIREAARRSLGWTEHLWRRHLQGRDYLKRLDPYYEDYFDERRWSRTVWENMNDSDADNQSELDSDESEARSTTDSEISAFLEEDRPHGDESSVFTV